MAYLRWIALVLCLVATGCAPPGERIVDTSASGILITIQTMKGELPAGQAEKFDEASNGFIQLIEDQCGDDYAKMGPMILDRFNGKTARDIIWEYNKLDRGVKEHLAKVREEQQKRWRELEEAFEKAGK
jgi:hypothetical protein